MSDDAAQLVLILLKELPCTRECNLVDIFVNLLLCHSDSVIDNLQCLCILVKLNAHGQFPKLPAELS